MGRAKKMTKSIIKFFAVSFLVLTSHALGFASEVPFRLEKGHIIVAAKIKKEIPVEVTIATGSAYSFLNPDLIRKHGIKLSYTGDGPITGRNDKIIHFAEVPQIIIGDEKPSSLFMKERSFAALNAKIGREIGAILGADFFRGRIFKIDFERKVLIFYGNSPFDYAQLKAAGTAAVSKVSDMEHSFKTFYGSELTLPVISNTTYDGTQIRTLLETGDPIPVSISASAVKEYSLALSVPDKGSTKVATLKSMNINGVDAANVPILVFGKNAGFDEGLREFGAILGIGVLQNFKVTFDWKAKKVVLER